MTTEVQGISKVRTPAIGLLQKRGLGSLLKAAKRGYVGPVIPRDPLLQCALSKPEENETGNWGRSKGTLRSGAEADRPSWQGWLWWHRTEFLLWPGFSGPLSTRSFLVVSPPKLFSFPRKDSGSHGGFKVKRDPASGSAFALPYHMTLSKSIPLLRPVSKPA